jgi:hypothetical protein
MHAQVFKSAAEHQLWLGPVRRQRFDDCGGKRCIAPWLQRAQRESGAHGVIGLPTVNRSTILIDLARRFLLL